MATGVLIGAQHALEPDHLAAVGTMLPEEVTPKYAVARGAWWGIGHGVAIALLGLPLIALDMKVPEQLEGAAEVLVAVMLVGLGAYAIYRAFQPKATEHQHAVIRRALPVGLTHGLAGSGAAVVLATTQAPTQWAAVSFLIIFVIGSTLGMTALVALASWPLGRLAKRPAGMKWLLVISGILSVVVGVIWGGPTVLGWFA